MLNHWDLCSGIGGFAFAFETIGLSRPTLFCDIEPWCREVLRKHWPDVPIYNDIKEIANDPDRFISGRVDILTSGFPCQPWSVAGKSKNLQQAKEDPRHIWPWIVDIIAQKRPKYCIFENVPNLAGLGGLDEVLVDLANQDYAATTFNISAYAGAGAPHKRERLWIYARNVADTNNDGQQRGFSETRNQNVAGENSQSVRATNTENSVGQSDDGGDHQKSRVDEDLSRLPDGGASVLARTTGVRGVSETEHNHKGVGNQDRYQENQSGALVQEGQGRVQPSEHRGLGEDQATFENNQIRSGDDNFDFERMDNKRAIVADTESGGRNSSSLEKMDEKEDRRKEGRRSDNGSKIRSMADTRCEHGQQRNSTHLEEEQTIRASRTVHSESGGQGQITTDRSARSEFRPMADGIPSRLGRFGEHEGWEKEPEGMTRVAVGVPDRASKLKGLGNAIVPQIAQKIGETILKLESQEIKNGKR